MSQRATIFVLATAAGVTSAASAIAAEALIALAALLLLILGSTLVIGTAIAAERSEPVRCGSGPRLVKVLASPSGDGGAPIAIHPRTPKSPCCVSRVDDDETGRAPTWLLARTGGRR